MKIIKKDLPHSRQEVTAEVIAGDTDRYFAKALEKLAAKMNLPGFRPGKAPLNIVAQKIGESEMREEASSLAVADCWRHIVTEERVEPIEDPAVEIVEFERGKPGKLVFKYDVRPEVKLAAGWDKIKIKTELVSNISDTDVEGVVASLARPQATTLVKTGAAEKGDRAEISFFGSIGGKKLDKLGGQKFMVELGQGGLIPGFEEQIVGSKKGDTKKFSSEFPKDHFDKEVAGRTADFELTINEVWQVIMPSINDTLAKKFGQPTVADLRQAIKKELNDQRISDQKIQTKAKWLAEFEKKIEIDLPESLVDDEVRRLEHQWREWLISRNLSPEVWLKSRSMTLAELEKTWRQNAASSVKIGLGLGAAARELKKDLKENDDFQNLLDELVEKATG